MATRRGWLVLGGVALVFSAVRPVAADTAGELQGGIYGGTTTGQWACGPSARVNYGGLGAQGRFWVSSRPKQPQDKSAQGESVPEGFNLGGGLATEVRGYRLLHCPGGGDDCTESSRQLPPTGFVEAASVSLGYDAKVFGIRLGGLATQRYSHHTDRKPSLLVFPEFHLRIGRLRGLRGEVGLGSYSVDTLLRPGLYFGGVGPIQENIEIAARLGVHQVFDTQFGIRGDLAAKFYMGGMGYLDAGVGLSTGEERASPHARLGFGAEF